jgi:hypothetical protein
MSFYQLPRDIQLFIIKQFDIDARIKTGIIGRIKIPNKLHEKLDQYLKTRILQRYEDLLAWVRISSHKYYMCYDETKYGVKDLYWYIVDTRNHEWHTIWLHPKITMK